MANIRNILLCSAAAAALAGCQGFTDKIASTWESVSNTAAEWTPNIVKPYRPDVHQGNLVTSEMLSQLEKGMSQDQVQFLLGVPLLKDKLHEDRWDYIYYLNRRSGEIQIRKLTVFFNEYKRVDRWETDDMPGETEADLLILGDKEEAQKAKEKEDAKEAVKAAAAEREKEESAAEPSADAAEPAGAAESQVKEQ